MDRLNLFNPFADKDITHEDVLTRNFLLLLKNVHAVQVAFFELIRGKMTNTINMESIALGQLSVANVYTQVKSGNRLANIQDHQILSIVISDDEYQGEHIVQESSRNARYDGVIICEPSWMFIVENKPSAGNIWENQLDPNQDDANGNYLIKDPCRLSWRQVIEALNSVLEHNIENTAENSLVEDFLEYINENYPGLNPYRLFGLCRGNKLLIDKRCGEILKECFPGNELMYHKGWKYYIGTKADDKAVKQVALDYYDNNISLWMYAGDTQNMAKALYRGIKIDRLKELNDGFIVQPNFHFSFMSTGLVWFSTTKINVFKYICYWKENEPSQLKRENFSDYYACLKNAGVIDPNDESFNKEITNTKRQRINVCPGILFGYKWSLEDAVRLDNEGKFAEDCRNKIEQIQSLYM